MLARKGGFYFYIILFNAFILLVAQSHPISRQKEVLKNKGKKNVLSKDCNAIQPSLIMPGTIAHAVIASDIIKTYFTETRRKFFLLIIISCPAYEPNK